MSIPLATSLHDDLSEIVEMKQGVIRQLFKGGFVVNFTHLAGGTMIAQLLMLLSSPILTRLYSTTEFGLYATYAAIVLIASPIVVLRYDVAIPLVSSRGELRSLVKVCTFSILTISAILLVCVILFKRPLSVWLGLDSAVYLLILLPFGVLITGCVSVLNYLCVSNDQFKIVSVSKVSHSLVHVSFQLLGHGFGTVSLAVGQFCGKLSAIVLMLPTGLRLLKEGLSGEHKDPHPIKVARDYRRFPLFSTWAALMNAMGEQLPFILLAAMFSPVAAGLFALAHRVLSVPITVVSSLVSEIFYANAAKHLEAGTLSQSFRETYRTLSMMITMPCLMVMIIAPDFFAFVFGEPWRQSGVFAQYLALLIASNFVSAPLSTVISVYKKDHEFLIFNIALLVLRTSAMLYGAFHDDLILSISLFCVVSAICYFGLLVHVNLMTSNNLHTIYENTVIPFLVNLIIAFPLIYMTMRNHDGWQWWIIFCLTCVAATGYLYFVSREQILSHLDRQSVEA